MAGPIPLAPRLLPPERAAELVDVLAEAFEDYPVVRHVLGPDPLPGADRARILVEFFVQARILRGEPLFGIPEGARLAGAALASDPEGPAPPPELDRIRTRTWERLGPEPRARYEAFGEATAAFPFPSPRLHLNMVGVRNACRGLGHGRRLVEAVVAHAETLPGLRGVTLTTEAPANVDLYRHLGFEVVGHARVGGTLESWGFLRPLP